MPETVLLDITTVILLGIGAQWLAWRFRLPSILLLLLVGFLAGPVLGFLDPQALQGDWLFAFVSLAVGIILFEGGLSLRLSDLREVGSAVSRLITVGVLITWTLGTVAAHYILGFHISLAILIGAILTVTGPTVVTPLLRHVRPKGRVGTIAKWEGITIDPVGAILSVLVLETILLLNRPTNVEAEISAAAEHVLIGLGLEIFVSLGVSVAATVLLVFILRRHLVPDFLRNSITLMIVVVAFVISNVMQQESGLLTTTLMGIALANQPYVSVQRIIEFKENLQVLLLGTLFVLLSARLEMSALEYLDVRVLVFLAILVVLVRPLAVLISSLGTRLEWEERTFLSWLGPRGVVAAAVASLFAYRLEPVFPQQVEGMVPIVFSVIVGTVAIYGLTLGPLAQWLGLADPNPEGLLFVGAESWVRKVARSVQQLGFDVYLIDNNPWHVQEAQEQGLPARQANALSETIVEELDLSSIGRLLITIPNDEVASLVALHFSDVFDTTDIFHLAAQPDSRHGGEGVMPKHLRGRPLFGESTSFQSLKEQASRGAEVKVLTLADEIPQDEQKESYTYKELTEQYEDLVVVPLFIVRDTGSLEVISEVKQVRLGPEEQFVALVGSGPDVRRKTDHRHPDTNEEPDVSPTVEVEEAQLEEDDEEGDDEDADD